MTPLFTAYYKVSSLVKRKLKLLKPFKNAIYWKTSRNNKKLYRSQTSKTCFKFILPKYWISVWVFLRFIKKFRFYIRNLLVSMSGGHGREPHNLFENNSLRLPQRLVYRVLISSIEPYNMFVKISNKHLLIHNLRK